MRLLTLVRSNAGVALAATTVLAGDAPLPTLPQKDEDDKEVLELTPFEVNASAGGYYASSVLAGTRMSTHLGATPGGFQDINFGRHLLEWGMLPRPGEITAEGLFSDYDLPTPEADAGGRLLVITGDAKAASILNKPEVTHLAQIGFSSGFDARTWKRDPVFLVVVADVSGSMESNLGLLKSSIRTMLDKLGPDDAFALVSFSDDVQLDRAPQRVAANDASAAAAIDRLAIRGGTNIEAGLARGFSVAQTPVTGSAGRTRVVLITDAMPNIGATGVDNFMQLAEAASLSGVGLTTIGVGLQFSAEFVKQVSSVSGGNAFYFATAEQMQEKVEADFDFMVTELAFDIEIRVEPAAGVRMIDVYGLPGDVYVRTPEGGLLLDLKTLFLSRERGAIFVSLATNQPMPEGTILGRASLSYSLHGAATPERNEFSLAVRSENKAGLGLRRGEMLTNEYEALLAAGRAFYEHGNMPQALAHAQALATLFAGDGDRELAREQELVEDVAAFLELAAHEPELEPRSLRARPETSPLVGVWRFVEDEKAEVGAPSEFLIFLPAGHAGFIDSYDGERMRAVKWKGRHLGDRRESSITLAVSKRGELIYRAMNRASRENVSWRLQRCRATEPWLPESGPQAAGASYPYHASEVLAGRRIETSLEDIATTMTVVTQDVLAGIEPWLVADESTLESDESVDSFAAARD